MGVGYYSVCDTCEVYQFNGYGSHYSWLAIGDWRDDVCLEAYDRHAALPEKVHFASYGKNKNIRHFLIEHHGHKLQLFYGDGEEWNDHGGEEYGFGGYLIEDRQPSPQFRYNEVPHPYQFGCHGCMKGSHFLNNHKDE